MPRESSCELCGGIVRPYSPARGEAPPMFRCPACGLVQVRLGPEEARRWASAYADGEGSYHRERVLAGFASYEERFEHDLALARVRLENLTRHVSGGRLLDVGSSNGAFPLLAWQYGFEAVALEPCPWVAERAAPLLGEGLIVDSFEHYAPEAQGASYEVASFIDSFEHLLRPHQALDEAARILRPGGVLMIEMPDADAPGFATRGPRWKHFKPAEHAYLYGRHHVLTLLGRHSFDLFDSIVPFPDRRVYYARRASWDRSVSPPSA